MDAAKHEIPLVKITENEMCTKEQQSTFGGKRTRQPRGEDEQINTSDAQQKRRRRTRARHGCWQLDRWSLKAVSQMKLYTSWMREQEYTVPLIYPGTQPRIDWSVAEEIPLTLRYRDGSVKIALSASPLPRNEVIIKAAKLRCDASTDIAFYESDGCLLGINIQVATFLVSTRKSVRLSLNQGPWPASEIVINSAIVQKLQNERFCRLSEKVLSCVRAMCEEMRKDRVIVYLRLGLDVGDDERSLIVCATASSSATAQETAHNIWKRILKLSLTDDHH